MNSSKKKDLPTNEKNSRQSACLRQGCGRQDRLSCQAYRLVPASVAAAVAKDIDAGGLAFHSGIENQTGQVSVMTYDMTIQPLDDRAECMERVVNYGPPERQTAASALRDLLKCAELNQEALEPETVEAIEAAELALRRTAA
jgi:hypothetical protein